MGYMGNYWNNYDQANQLMLKFSDFINCERNTYHQLIGSSHRINAMFENLIEQFSVFEAQNFYMEDRLTPEE